MPSLDELLRITACPDCVAALEKQPGGILRCVSCAAEYPVANGVPLLLSLKSRSYADESKNRLDENVVYHLSPRWRSLRKRIAAPSPFWSPYRERIRESLRPHLDSRNSVVLHLGSKEAFLAPNAIHVDLYPFSGVNLVTDAEQLAISSEVIDCVYAPALLEHVTSPRSVIQQVHRVLRPGGLVVVEVPFIQGFHADPDDYQRFTVSGLRHLMSAFDEIDAGALAGPSSSLAWVLRDWLAAWVPRHVFPRAHRAFRIATGWSTFWLRYADYLLIRTPAAHELACGVYFVGRKATAAFANALPQSDSTKLPQDGDDP